MVDSETIISNSEPEFEKALNFLKQEFNKLHTSRISPALVEDVVVEFNNNKSPLKAWAAISCPEPQTLLIQPWHASYLKPITKALEQSDIGIQPLVQGQAIWLKAPSLTAERRQELVKIATRKAENVFQTMRKIRDDAWKQIQEAEKRGEISEDQKFQLKDKLEELAGQYKDKLDELVERKKNEIQS